MRAYERLLRYLKFEAPSDAGSETFPSTPQQLNFGRYLVQEMRELGIRDAELDENGYVFGTIESNIKNWSGPVIGFLAHLDTVQDVPYQNIKAQIIEDYDGGDLCLNP